MVGRDMHSNGGIAPHGRAARAVAMLAAASLTIGGCATGLSGPVVTADDPCSSYRQPIADVKRSGLQPDDVLLAVGVGTAAGVVTGLATGKPAAGLAAALVGVTATAGTRYLQRQQQAHQNRQQLAAAIYQDEVRDGSSFAPARAAVAQLRGCRRQQFDALLTDVRRKQATQGEARSRFDKLLAQRRRDDEIVSAALDTAGQRVGLYQEAVEKSQSEELYSAFARRSGPVPPVPAQNPAGVRNVAHSPRPASAPLRAVVDDVKQTEEKDRRGTDSTVDSLHVLLG
ncbi:hypothetical protein [Belnapia rosea]|uniref:Uncharacterized protein n=1 Tax=Belnapia rosea TaxID=938405 RepID=A0A1G6S467_9PROT|nr:hypothetical protein [Belnapia rosea]SDD11649.1 hypothetical protein SAMN04487779_1004269 [Belnapia rosea]